MFNRQLPLSVCFVVVNILFALESTNAQAYVENSPPCRCIRVDHCLPVHVNQSIAKDAILSEIRSTAGCSCGGSGLLVARLTLQLLDSRPHFLARTSGDHAQPDYWSLLSASQQGRALATKLTVIYQKIPYHPNLTESQLILLRSAVALADSDQGVVAEALLVMGNLIERQSSPEQKERKTLLLFPCYLNAFEITKTRDAKFSREVSELIGRTHGIELSDNRYFGGTPHISAVGSLKNRVVSLKRAVDLSSNEQHSGSRLYHLHEIASCLVLLTLLDLNCDFDLTDYFKLIEDEDSSENGDLAKFVAWAEELAHADQLAAEYLDTLTSIKQIAVEPSEDIFLKSKLTNIRKLLDSSIAISTGLTFDLFASVKNAPKNIRRRISQFGPPRD